jgi:hypothetical protein
VRIEWDPTGAVRDVRIEGECGRISKTVKILNQKQSTFLKRKPIGIYAEK